MKKKTIAMITAGSVLVAAGGIAGYEAADKKVQVVADGASSTVHTFGSTVTDALAADGILLGEHDSVTPAASSPIRDGSVVTISFGRPVRLVIDNERREVWSTATTLGAALDQARIDSGAKLSLPRSTPLGRDGLTVVATTPKKLTLSLAGHTEQVTSTATTVAELLRERNITLGKGDSVDPAGTYAVTQGMVVTVKKTATRTTTTTEPIIFKTRTTTDANLPVGTTQTLLPGRNGQVTRTWQLSVVDGKVTGKVLLSTRTTARAQNAYVAIGTKPLPSAAPSASAKPSAVPTNDATPTTTSDAGTDLSREAMWDRIAQCESSGDWSINTGNGYYGGLQFNIPTWLSVGGDKYASRPDLATRAQQITMANKLYAQRGLQPWECGHAA